MKLELKHVQPYPMGKKNPLMFLIPKHRFKYGEQTTLPMNGVAVESDVGFQIEFLLPDDDLLFSTQLNWFKPILHPLSDITKEIKVSKEIFEVDKLIPTKSFPFFWDEKTKTLRLDNRERPLTMEYYRQMMENLYAMHFNVFNLPQELWIDINTLEQ